MERKGTQRSHRPIDIYHRVHPHRRRGFREGLSHGELRSETMQPPRVSVRSLLEDSGELSDLTCRYHACQSVLSARNLSCKATHLFEPQTTTSSVRFGPDNPILDSSLSLMTRSDAGASA